MIYETVFALGALAMVLAASTMFGYELRIVQEYRAKERRRKRKEFYQSAAEYNCRHQIKPIYEFTVGNAYVPHDRFMAYSGIRHIQKGVGRCQQEENINVGR